MSTLNTVLEPDRNKLLNIENSNMRIKHVWANVVNTIPIPTAVIDIHQQPFKILAHNSLFYELFASQLDDVVADAEGRLDLSDFFANDSPFIQSLRAALETQITEKQHLVLSEKTRLLKITISPFSDPNHPDDTKPYILYFEHLPSEAPEETGDFRAVIENIEGIFWRADAATLRFTYVSPQVRSILGYEPSEWIEDPNFWVDHIHDEDRNYAVNFCHVQTELGLNHNFEYRMIASDGTTVWLKDVVSIVRGDDGSRQLVGLMIDISDKKAAEEQLLNKKDELKMLLKSASEGLYGLNQEGQCTFINDAAARMLGYPKEQLLGKTMHELIHPSERLEKGHRRKKCPICNAVNMSVKHERQHDRFFRSDGSAFDVCYSSAPLLENGKQLGVVVTFSDTTEQLETNRQLLHAKKTLNKILQQSLDLICTFDREGRFTNVSDASLKILGYAPEELIGKKYTDFLIPEDIRATLRTGSLVMRGGSRSNFENRYIRKDGTIVPILWSARWDVEEERMYCTGKDATELKKAHEQLELSERRFRQLVKGSSDIIAVLDFSGKCLYVSPTSNPLLGYSSEEFTGQIAFEHIHPADLAEIKALFADLPLDTLVFPNAFRFRHKNGTWRWMETSLKNLSHDPAVGGIVSNLRDVTERVEALRLIEESNERYTYVMRATFDAIRDWDMLENHIHWGDGLQELFGYNTDSRNDNLSFWLRNIHPEDAKRVEHSLKTAIESDTEIWRDEYRFRRADESYAYVVDKSIIIRNENGNAIRLVGAIQDITSRKTEELRLKLLESVIVNMTDAVLVIRVDDSEEGQPIIVYCNKAFSDMTGYSLSEVYGRSPLFFERPETDFETVEALYAAYDNKQNFECELEYYKKSGEPFWLSIVLSPIIDEDGECNHFIAIERDITERKKSELELKQLYEELELRAKKLAISNFELEQFAYVASHDLQEPLRMVTSFLTLLEKRYADKLDDKAREFIFFAVDGATRMRQIILDLLDYSRIGKGDIALSDIDLNRILDEIWDTFRTLVDESQATLVIEAPLPVIRSLETPIRQVFQNLISNSLKYILNGKHPVISVSHYRTEEGYEFLVKDNGIGINEQYHEKIFNIFQRLHTKEEYSGTGMGLAITKKIIENLGGTIRVESIENEGSTFIFTLPETAIN